MTLRAKQVLRQLSYEPIITQELFVGNYSEVIRMSMNTFFFTLDASVGRMWPPSVRTSRSVRISRSVLLYEKRASLSRIPKKPAHIGRAIGVAPMSRDLSLPQLRVHYNMCAGFCQVLNTLPCAHIHRFIVSFSYTRHIVPAPLTSPHILRVLVFVLCLAY